jgi:ABC-2 type transport system permease protein
MQGRGGPMDVNEWVVRPLLMNVSVFGLFLIPMITMRIFAEEKRSGTMELLATSPVTDMQIILGKYLGGLLMYSCLVGVAVLNIAILFAFGKPDWKPILIGALGLILQGGCLLAIGTFISSTTRNQIIAGAGTFAVCLLLWILDWSTAFNTSTSGKILSYLSVMQHYDSFSKGVLDSKHVIFYLSFIFFGLFLTARSLESLRWRA